MRRPRYPSKVEDMDNNNTNTAAIVNALVALFVAKPLMMAENFLELAEQVTAMGTFADTKTIGEAWDYMDANGMIDADLLADMEAQSLAIWEAKEDARREARSAEYAAEHRRAEARAMARNGN